MGMNSKMTASASSSQALREADCFLSQKTDDGEEKGTN